MQSGSRTPPPPPVNDLVRRTHWTHFLESFFATILLHQTFFVLISILNISYLRLRLASVIKSEFRIFFGLTTTSAIKSVESLCSWHAQFHEKTIFTTRLVLVTAAVSGDSLPNQFFFRLNCCLLKDCQPCFRLVSFVQLLI